MDQDDDELRAFARAQQRRRLLSGAVLLGVVAAGVVAYLTLKPSACEQLAAEICTSAGLDCTEQLAAGMSEKIPEQACAETLEAMRAAEDAVPPEMVPFVKAEALRMLMREQMGVDPLKGVGEDAAAGQPAPQ